MNDTLRLAMAQHDFPVGALARNAEKILKLVEQAKSAGADVLLFPELALSGYPPEDLLLRPGFLADCERTLAEIAAQVQGITVVLPSPRAVGAVVFNTANIIQDVPSPRFTTSRNCPIMRCSMSAAISPPMPIPVRSRSRALRSA
jgi:NAD+ synthase (glutamine-hydrolysing)